MPGVHYSKALLHLPHDLDKKCRVTFVSLRPLACKRFQFHLIALYPCAYSVGSTSHEFHNNVCVRDDCDIVAPSNENIRHILRVDGYFQLFTQYHVLSGSPQYVVKHTVGFLAISISSFLARRQKLSFSGVLALLSISSVSSNVYGLIAPGCERSLMYHQKNCFFSSDSSRCESYILRFVTLSQNTHLIT